MKFTALLLALLTTVAAAAEPKYPLKSARTLHNDGDIARMRRNIEKYPSARAVADAVIKRADNWVDWKDEDLIALLTDSKVPRAFAVSASGCPNCGDKLKQHGGDYAWLIDPKISNKVKCPVDDSVFPDKDHPDDGWGWTNPKTGEKFWFVAYYNHWMWHKYLVLGLNDLGNAYLITGDKRYAHKVAAMLHRIAEVYPAMDHAKQSRYGEMMAARGADYPGKVVNAIWETGLAQCLAEGYDAVWETIDGDEALHKSTGKTGEQIRSFIEANVLEEAIAAYFSGKIRGNFGMHQRTLVYLALVRQHGENDKWFDMLLNDSSSSYPTLGLSYALYNLISRDGVPMEGAPGYNNIWVRAITDYGDLLARGGRNVFENPRVKRMYDAIIDQINVGKFTPDVGDSGNVFGGLAGTDAETFQAAYRHFPDPRYAAVLNRIDATGESSFKTFDSLFTDPIPASDAKLPPAKSRLLPGYGMAILNNPADTISMSLYYAQTHGHGHYDRLNFDIYANGQKMLPDLGYPDAMNAFVPGIYTWSQNTIAHNTVVVDAKRQLGEAPGTVLLFADSPFARVVDVDAPQTYPGCTQYRRTILMIDCGPDQSYFIDTFLVTGGKQHDYSLHGPPGEFEIIEGKWSDASEGTLAGADVPLGKIYDDPALGAADYKGGYSTYTGSGFQHLFNVRKRLDGPVIAQYQHEKNAAAKLRIRVLPNAHQTNFLCDAHISPAKYPQIIKYLITRGTGSTDRFVSIIEPFKDTPFIKDVKEFPLRRPDQTMLEVTREGGDIDVILINLSGEEVSIPARGMRTRATAAVTTWGEGRKITRWFRALQAPPFSGTVLDVLPLSGHVKIKLKGDRPFDDPQALVGRVVQFVNDRHRTSHPVTAARREDSENIILTLGDDILIGLAKLDSINEEHLTTSTAMPLAPSYPGTFLADELFRLQHPVKSVEGGKINLASPLPGGHPLKPGDKVWLMDIGPGDAIEIPKITWKLEEAK